jgi:hypothetical protein
MNGTSSRKIAIGVVMAAAGCAVATASASLALQGKAPVYPLLVVHGTLRVYGPPTHGAGCPTLAPLSDDALAKVRTAVRLAMPPFEARLKLDGADARVSVELASASALSPTAAGCGRAAWRRSVLAKVNLPDVRAASLSQHTFAVGRTGRGWVLWAWIR